MKDNSSKAQAEIWKKLAAFARTPEGADWRLLAQEFALPETEARRMMVAIHGIQQQLEQATGASDEVYQSWNWAHWFQLTHLLETLVQDPSQQALRPVVMNLLKQQRQHPAYLVYQQIQDKVARPPSTGPVPLAPDPQREFAEHKVRLIEEALLEKKTVLVEVGPQKVVTVIPCQLSYLEGQLSLVAEETNDHSLLCLPLDEMVNIRKGEKIKSARAHQHEIAEFISALRSMNENEIRLVLKIKDPQRFNLQPDYQFLGKPYLVSNPEGDLIWAAWVEPSEELMAWMYEMEQHVEILEPGEFLLDFIAYCEEKERKLA